MSGVKCSVAEGRRAARLEVRRLPDAARVAVALLAFELERAVHVVHAEGQPLLACPDARAASARTRTACSRPGARRASARRARRWCASRRRRPPGRRAGPASPTGTSIVRAYQPICAVSRNTGERGSPRERHRDGQREGHLALLPGLGQPLIVRVEAELPRAVQVHPRRALEVGARVLRQRLRRLGAGSARQQDGRGERRVQCVGAFHAWTSTRKDRIGAVAPRSSARRLRERR